MVFLGFWFWVLATAFRNGKDMNDLGGLGVMAIGLRFSSLELVMKLDGDAASVLILGDAMILSVPFCASHKRC